MSPLPAVTPAVLCWAQHCVDSVAVTQVTSGPALGKRLTLSGPLVFSPVTSDMGPWWVTRDSSTTPRALLMQHGWPCSSG